jgi:hypothetical protein
MIGLEIPVEDEQEDETANMSIDEKMELLNEVWDDAVNNGMFSQAHYTILDNAIIAYREKLEQQK